MEEGSASIINRPLSLIEIMIVDNDMEYLEILSM